MLLLFANIASADANATTRATGSVAGVPWQDEPTHNRAHTTMTMIETDSAHISFPKDT